MWAVAACRMPGIQSATADPGAQLKSELQHSTKHHLVFSKNKQMTWSYLK